MSVKLLRPNDRILLVTAGNAGELGKMFLRPQEFFESPRFRGKFFTHDEFKSYYRVRWGGGHFTYFSDYCGYNVPGDVFLDWQAAYASRETEEELDLLRLLGPLPDRFYLIGAVARDAGTVDHELSHALFHLCDEYRGAVTAQVALYSKELRPLRRALRAFMYREEVLDDECVSYVLFEGPWMRSKGLKTKVLEPLRGELSLLYRKHRRVHIRPKGAWRA